MKETLKKALRPAAHAAVALTPYRGTTVIEMDGGISSQMKFVIVGKKFEELGRKVAFDTHWYADWGKDINGVHARNFDLMKMFPAMEIAIAPRNVGRLVRLAGIHDNGTWGCTIEKCDATLPKSIYLDGYYEPSPADFNRIFRQTFVRSKADTSDETYKALEAKIMQSPYPIAIHARRGDLTKAIEGYGEPVGIDYFRNAVNLCTAQTTVRDFDIFIFSDDPQWCRTNLVPALPEGRASVVDIFDSSKGYLDMLAISHCRSIIASKGSFGKYAAMLSPDNPHLVLADDESEKIWSEIYTHAPLSFVK